MIDFNRSRRATRILAIAAIATFCWHRNAGAQHPLPAPNLDLRAGGAIWAMALQPDGALVFAGQFDSVEGSPRPGIARLKPDGTLDEQWNPPLAWASQSLASCGNDVFVNAATVPENGEPIPRLLKLDVSDGTPDPLWGLDAYAYAMACGADGKLHVATADRIYRLSTKTGEIDPSWTIWIGGIRLIAPSPDGRIYIAGTFTGIDGQSHVRLARLSATGEIDPTWIPELPGEPDDVPQALAFAFDGSVFAGGAFGVVKLSGTTGAPVLQWQSSSGDVRFLDVTPDGSTLLVGGGFSHMGGQSRSYFARLSTVTGAALSEWTVSPNNVVLSGAIAPDGSLHLGGHFDSVGADAAYGLAKITSAGTLQAPLPEVLNPGAVYALASHSDGSIVVGGNFVKVEGQARRHLMRLRADASLDSEWIPDLDFAPWKLAVDDATGSVYAAGDGPPQSDRRTTRLAKIASTGAVDASWHAYADGGLSALAVGPDHGIYVGGLFDSVNGIARKGIAKLTPSTGTVVSDWDARTDGSVTSIVVAADDKLYLGGYFTKIGGVARPWAARLSSASAILDTTWNPNLPGAAQASALDAGGNLYVGGQSSMAEQAPFPFAFKLSEQDGSTMPEWHADLWAVWDITPWAYFVNSIVVDANETVYLSGIFGVPGDIDERSLARFSGQNGLVDVQWRPSFFGSSNIVTEIGADRVYVGGDFSRAGGQPRQGLAAFQAARPDRLFASGFEAGWP